jgi:hypothetical protein
MRLATGNSLIASAFAVSLLLWVGGCSKAKIDHPSLPPVSLSSVGLSSLIEAECFEWRSYPWARQNYLIERDNCWGSEGDIEDCQARISDEDWLVQTNDPKTKFKLSYFFGLEVKEPKRDKTSCSVLVPDDVKGRLLAAAQSVAQRRNLDGPFKNGEKGFSIPTLERFWTDKSGNPAMAIFSHEQDDSQDPEHYYRGYPWELERNNWDLKTWRANQRSL